MPVIQLILVLATIGILLWIVNTYVPMQATIKQILNGVVIIATVLWLLDVFGVLTSLGHIRIGH